MHARMPEHVRAHMCYNTRPCGERAHKRAAYSARGSAFASRWLPLRRDARPGPTAAARGRKTPHSLVPFTRASQPTCPHTHLHWVARCSVRLQIHNFVFAVAIGGADAIALRLLKQSLRYQALPISRVLPVLPLRACLPRFARVPNSGVTAAHSIRAAKPIAPSNACGCPGRSVGRL